MCEPTMLLGLASTVKSLVSKPDVVEPPEVPEPTPVSPEAAEETGADVELGGLAETDKPSRIRSRSKAAKASTSKSGLNHTSRKTGVSIL